nr:hypothetical protein [Tanacetum cinerariifolium]
MDHNIDFSGFDQIQTPQYPDVQENPLTNDEFEAFMKANDDKMNDLEIKFDQFQKQCEQMQDDLLNKMRNFMQNFQSGPPEDKRECDLLIFENSPVCDNSDTFSDSEINDDILVYNDDFENIEYVEALLFDPAIVSVEEENVVHREEEEVDLEDIS